MTEMGMDLLTAAVRSLDEAVLADQPGERYTAAHVAALRAAAGLVSLQAILFFFDYYFVFPSKPEYEIAFAKNYDHAVATGVAGNFGDRSIRRHLVHPPLDVTRRTSTCPRR